MNKDFKTTVLDAGGRYGLHPSWKPFTGELLYYLFEPDPVESKRLQKKYSRQSDEVKVVGSAVAEQDGRLTIHFLRNRAMSSSTVRNPVSSLFKGERLREVDVVESIETEYALDVARYDKIRNGLEQRRQKNKTGPVLVFSAGNPRHRDYP